MNSNYLKQEISGVSEFKLKQLESSREEFLLFDFLPYNSLSGNKHGGGGGGGEWWLDVGHKHGGGNERGLSTTEVVPVALDRGLSCATDTALDNCDEKWKGPSR